MKDIQKWRSRKFIRI